MRKKFRLGIMISVFVALACTTPPATPLITILADQTLIVPVGVENAPEVCFNVTGPGTLKGFVDVISGQKINYYLYPEPVSYTHLTLPTTPYV